jgi:hypothetical protein
VPLFLVVLPIIGVTSKLYEDAKMPVSQAAACGADRIPRVDAHLRVFSGYEITKRRGRYGDSAPSRREPFLFRALKDSTEFLSKKTQLHDASRPTSMVDPQPTRRRNASAIWQFQKTGLAVDASIGGVFNDVVMLDRDSSTRKY